MAILRPKLWRQSFPFTCGPAALGSVLTSLGWKPERSQREAELKIWREGTAIGCPGTHPLGLALAAKRRGFSATVFWSGPAPWLWRHIRSAHPGLSLRDYRAIEAAFARDCTEAEVPVYRNRTPSDPCAPGVLLATAGRGTAAADPHWVGVLPGSAKTTILDPLRRAPRTVSEPFRQWWEASGFHRTRSWIEVRP